LVKYTNTVKQIKIWNIKINFIYILGVFTVNELNKGSDLLFDNLFFSAKTKLGDRLAPNAFRKKNKSRKLKSNKKL